MSPDDPGLHIRLLKLKNKLSGGLGWLLVGLLVLFAAIIIGFPLFMLAGQGVGLWRMATWTGQTTGTVESVTVVRSRPGRGTSSGTHVTYAYRVGDNTYTGTRIGPEWGIQFMEVRGAALAKEFQQGQSIVVHYDPDHPEQAFLWPKIRKALVGVPATILFFLSFFFVRRWNWQRTFRRKTVPACALVGMGASGLVLLFVAPVYIVPWVAGAALGGGALGGAAWGWWNGQPRPVQDEARPRKA